MAGHSKWANIQHRKNKQDAKRGKAFTKIIRLITVAARMGGADAASNPRLREALLKARGVNMPNDNIDRAIKKGAGGGDANTLEEITYEGYAPGGVAMMVHCLTDNRNRTVGDVRHAFTKCGGNLGTDGSVAYLFTKQGHISFKKGANEEKILEIGLEHGVEDIVTNNDGSIDVTVSAESFSELKEALEKQQLIPDYADIALTASTEITLDAEMAEKLIRLQDMLEDLDDVQEVYSNADIPEEVMQAFEKSG